MPDVYSYSLTNVADHLVELTNFGEICNPSPVQRYAIIVDGTMFYHTGLAWAESDGTWAQCTLADDLDQNIATLPIDSISGSALQVYAINNDTVNPAVEFDGVQFRGLTTNVKAYNIGVLLKFRTIMLGNGKKSNVPIRIQLAGLTRTQQPRWKNQVIENTRQLIYTDGNGEAEIYLPPNDEITPITVTYYNIRIGNNNAINIKLENTASTQYFDQITPL